MQRNPPVITAIGIDIAETDRMNTDLERFGERFARRILGPSEWNDYRSQPDKAAYLARQFAAKEAVIKALGQYLEDRPPLNIIQVLPADSGLQLHLPEGINGALKGARCLISISHTECHATAIAIFTEEK
jgi:phosphopantetheine--protein transferase-like protein